MRAGLVISLLLPFICCVSFAQQESTGAGSHSLETVPGDSLLRPIPIVLPPQLFIPSSRLSGLQPWLYAPIVRPSVIYMPVAGFNGGEGFGQYFQQHPDKFFSNLLGHNVISLPNLYVTRQMMVGNTLRLDKKGRVYLLSGIMYGSQMGVMGNNWGMGSREGILIRTKGTLSVVIWNQGFRSVMVYSPVLHPTSSGDGAAVIMPATPQVASFGVQASFVSGEFIIDIGTFYRYK
jgi:uncharacterized membrane protein (UPF0136 family)